MLLYRPSQILIHALFYTIRGGMVPSNSKKEHTDYLKIFQFPVSLLISAHLHLNVFLLVASYLILLTYDSI